MSYGNAGGSETLLGRALGSRRAEVIIATKFGSDMRGANGPDWGVRGSRRYIRIAVESSLRRLGTDWIDLYQLHEPDPHTPIDETLAALTEIVTEGKVRYIGSSNLAGWQVIDADWTSRTSGYEAFISAQNEYSWLNRSVERELIPALEHTGQSLLPFFPLGSGLLTGKYRRGEPAPTGSRLASQSGSARRGRISTCRGASSRTPTERDLSILEVAIGGLSAMPTVGSVIAGATSAEQVKQNVAAAQWVPSGDDLEVLLEITKPAL